MSQTDAPVPTADADATDRRTVDDWAADHQIDAWLLPLSSRKDDPIELVRTFTEYLADAGAYQATFTTTEVGRQFHSGYGEQMRKLFLLREVGSTNRKNRYVNPNYAHLGHHEPAIEDSDERRAFFEFFADSPTADGEFFATHFGVSTSYIWDWMSRRGIDWSARVQRNKERMGRTLYTIAEWDSGHTQLDLAEAIPANTNTVKGWIREHGLRADDWSPPERPTDEPWFKRFAGMGDQ